MIQENQLCDGMAVHMSLKDDGGKQLRSIWYWISRAHLYTTKSEALFKAFQITVSWVGGLGTTPGPTAYYLFSLSIIMEYAVQLVLARKIIPKALPFILTFSNIVVALCAFSQLVTHQEATFPFQFYIEISTLIIIWTDATTILLIENPDEYDIENDIQKL